MTDAKDKLIESIKSHLQFAATLAMFFASLLYVFFKFAKEVEEVANSIQLQTANIVVSYLIAYILFYICKSKISLTWLKLLNWTVIIGIGAFIFPLGFVASKQLNIVGWPTYFSFYSSVWVLVGTPIVFSGLTILALLWKQILIDLRSALEILKKIYKGFLTVFRISTRWFQTTFEKLKRSLQNHQ